MLTTVGMRNAIITGAGVNTIEDLLLIYEDSLINACTNNTTVMAKIKLITLKRWTEREADIDETTLDINFTSDIYRELQREIARTKK